MLNLHCFIRKNFARRNKWNKNEQQINQPPIIIIAISLVIPLQIWNTVARIFIVFFFPSLLVSGPASPLPELHGYSRCGHALVLKGLVFPQWKRRPLAVIGSRLFLYPGMRSNPGFRKSNRPPLYIYTDKKRGWNRV